MAALAIVEHFDVLKDRQLRLLTGLIGMPVRLLARERTEEGSHGGIVIAIAFATHADLDPSLSKSRLVGIHWCTGSRDPNGAAVRPRDVGALAPVQDLLDQFCVAMGCHSPSYHQAQEEIKHGRHIQPTLGRPHDISASYALDDALAAFAYAAQPGVLKVLVKI